MDPDATLTKELLARYLDGGGEAERRLFEEHHGRILARAANHPWMSSLQPRISPEDVANEVFLRVLSSGFLRRFEDRGRGSLEAALVKIVERVLADHHRRDGAVKRGAGWRPVSLSDTASAGRPGPALPASDTTPTSSARAQELTELGRNLLDPREREVWERVDIRGLDPQDAAKQLEITGSAARSLLHRARRKLLLVLAEAEDG